jgi:hypothetical protein
MNTRTTLLLALVAGGSFAYLWFVDRHQESTRDAVESSSKVVTLERDQVSQLTIRNGNSLIVLEKKDEVWQMEQPLQDRADPSAIDRLLGLLDGLRHDAKIELPPGKEQDSLKEFGLVDSETSLKWKTTAGKETELLLGKDSAVAGKFYIRRKGQNAAFVVRNDLRNRLTAGPDEFRDHRLSTLQVSSVQKFTIRNGESEVELERHASDWDIVKPLRARADTARTNDFLATLLGAQISQFFPDAPSPEQGLSEPRATVTAVVEGQKEPVVLQIGATPSGEENKDRSFAKISGRSAVTVVPNTVLDPLLKARPNDLRDRKLVRVEPDIVDRITIETRDGEPLLLIRKGEGWTCTENGRDIPVKEGLAAKLLSEIIAAESVKFVADLSADLNKYGLAKPRLRVRLSSFATENTAESKSGENPLVTLLFGEMDGDACHVKLEEEPFIVTASKTFLDSIPTDALALRPGGAPEALMECKAKDVSSVSLEGPNLTSVRLEKAEGGWKAVGSEQQPIGAQVDSLLAKLESAQAERIAGEHRRLRHALSAPVLTFRFTSSSNGSNTQQTLTVGTPLKDGLHPAAVGGKEGIYLLPADLVTALRQNLFQ